MSKNKKEPELYYEGTECKDCKVILNHLHDLECNPPIEVYQCPICLKVSNLQTPYLAKPEE